MLLSLGIFDKDNKTGKFTGMFGGIGIPATRLSLEPAVNDRGHAYYRVMTHSQNASFDAGEAWPKLAATGKAALSLSVKLSSPGLAHPFYGRLCESETTPGQYHLYWDESCVKFRAETTIRR